MNVRYPYLVFDFDGTLADTGEGVLKSAKFALDFYQIPAPRWEDLGFFVGPPLYDSFRMLPGIDHNMALRLVEKYRERYRATGVFESFLYPGMAELLEELKQSGAVLSIASSKPAVFIETLLQAFQIADYFETVSGIGLDNVHHPKSELIETALQRCGCKDYAGALMIGDRKFDIEGAHAIGVPCAALEHGYGNREEFEQWAADAILKDTAALRAFLSI